MAGGVALNCVSNGRLLREGPFDEIFVQPAAGDNGACLGAALHVAHRKLGQQRGSPQRHAFLGPAFTDAEVRDAAAARGLTAEEPDDVIERTAELLSDGGIVGWMQGRMEFGPRALGGRSILADPRCAETKERLNASVKFREAFRPFAPSVALEAASDWFDDARPSPFMLTTFHVKRSQQERIPGVVHVDGSARVQTVSADENPKFHALLHAFGQRTGVPLLLNTSFNIRGEPIVSTPGEALEALIRTGLSAVVLGATIFHAPS